jgi:hypothetical protein
MTVAKVTWKKHASRQGPEVAKVSGQMLAEESQNGRLQPTGP